MFLVDALLILAMMFFLFLPITDRRTVRMKLCMLFALLAVFSVSVAGTHVAPVQLAGIVSTH
jgi:high-affinity Fe2+/Pb2+ permease